MTYSRDQAQTFKTEVEGKIEDLLDEFAGGDISREQFDMIYARYSRQLMIAEEALEKDKPDEIQKVMNEIPTMALRAAIRGKALGLAVINHRDLDILRVFGMFDLDEATLAPILHDLTLRLQSGKVEFVNSENLYGNTWIIISSLERSTLVTLFRNEPSAKQIQELERRHRDFESANRNILNQPKVDPDTLVYPVQLFVSSS